MNEGRPRLCKIMQKAINSSQIADDNCCIRVKKIQLYAASSYIAYTCMIRL